MLQIVILASWLWDEVHTEKLGKDCRCQATEDICLSLLRRKKFERNPCPFALHCSILKRTQCWLHVALYSFWLLQTASFAVSIWKVAFSLKLLGSSLETSNLLSNNILRHHFEVSKSVVTGSNSLYYSGVNRWYHGKFKVQLKEDLFLSLPHRHFALVNWDLLGLHSKIILFSVTGYEWLDMINYEISL